MSAKRKADIYHRAANRPRVMKSVGSRTDSERDSGFSDASSEYMSAMETADLEDSPQSKRGSQPSQMAVVGGSYSSLSPMIIMNNVLLKQPRDNPPTLKPWGFSPTVEVVQPVVQQPQVVFIQPVVSRQSSSITKETKSRHRRPTKYLPILKSYPKIAPHPGDSSSSSSSGRGTGSSSSHSSSSGSERCSASTSNHQEHCPRENRQRSFSGGASNSGSTTPSLAATPTSMSPLPLSRLPQPSTDCSTSRDKPSTAVSQAELTSPQTFTPVTSSKKKTPRPTYVNDALSECTSSDSDVDTKRKRFCNTYNILSQSGLLDITLRTKELLRQNRRTQSDLDRLREQTDMFLQVMKSGDTSICEKLQASLREDDREKEKESSSDQRKSRIDQDLGLL